MRILSLALAALLVLVAGAARAAVATREAPPRAQVSPDILVVLLRLDDTRAVGQAQPQPSEVLRDSGSRSSSLPSLLLVLEVDSETDLSWIPETRVAAFWFSGGYPTGADPPESGIASGPNTHRYDNSRKAAVSQGLRREFPGPDELLSAQFRHANPRLGRWVKRDPGGFLDSWNRYLWLRNDPFKHVDLDGLQATPVTPTQFALLLSRLNAVGAARHATFLLNAVNAGTISLATAIAKAQTVLGISGGVATQAGGTAFLPAAGAAVGVGAGVGGASYLLYTRAVRPFARPALRFLHRHLARRAARKLLTDFARELIDCPHLAGGAGPVQKGQQGVQDTIDEIEAAGGEILGEEITMDVGGTSVRIDILAKFPPGSSVPIGGHSIPGGIVVIIEVKTGPHARLTRNQRRSFPRLPQTNVVPRGGNAAAAGLTPGQSRPGYPVFVVRR